MNEHIAVAARVDRGLRWVSCHPEITMLRSAVSNR